MKQIFTENRSPEQTINLTEIITRIIIEVAEKVPLYNHIHTNNILVSIASNRRGSKGGIYGKLVPLRFKNGVKMLRYQGNYYAMPQIVHQSNEIKYLIYFYIPRFLDLHPMEKLKVIFHELYHISPDFNGDIRRMNRRKAYHGNTKKAFDSIFDNECKQFYKYISKTEFLKFLQMNTTDIYSRYQKVYGRRMKLPHPIVSEN